ncbi:MAG: hypothetical protein IT349_21820, partial [Candidatus Eisenbacteria bacterium]|nr:hypothetical protein [Candidatus Eisenbacteria bacterium]
MHPSFCPRRILTHFLVVLGSLTAIAQAAPVTPSAPVAGEWIYRLATADRVALAALPEVTGARVIWIEEDHSFALASDQVAASAVFRALEPAPLAPWNADREYSIVYLKDAPSSLPALGSLGQVLDRDALSALVETTPEQTSG